MDEFYEQLEVALDLVEQGYVTEDRMAMIRYACGVTKRPTEPVVFNHDEIR